MVVLKEILLFDSTLRDGSHAINHQLTKEHIERYCRAMDQSGMHTIIVGHGNGLGASSVQMGMSLLDEIDMLQIASENLSKTKLGAFLTVGFGTIKRHIEKALYHNVKVFCIACHCTEADITKKYIEYIARKGKEVYGTLMMYHMAEPEKILEEALKMQDYGADGVILMDSAGTSTLEMVRTIISTLKNKLNIKIGFHAHNNLGLAVANSYIAAKEGASIIDGTLRGFGAGAGNCQLEAFAALMAKEKWKTDVNLYSMLDASENIIKDAFGYDKGTNSTCIISGYAGVVSTFKPKVELIASKYHIDPRDIFIELGRRNAIAGQDDLILEVAEYINNIKTYKN